MDNNIQSVFDKIDKLYEGGFLEKYGFSLLSSIVILFLAILLITYFYIKRNFKTIKSNWAKERCKPNIMPFAGLIVEPTHTSKMQFTEENFAYCTQNILTDISSTFLAPIYYINNTLSSTLKEAENSTNSIRELFNNIRNALSSVIQDIYSRILNVMTPVMHMAIKVKAILGKIKGALTANIYTLLGSYMTIQTTIRSVFEIIVIILIALAVAIVLLWFIPFIGVGLALTATAFFVAIAVPLGLIAHFSAEVLNIQNLSQVPGL